MTDLTPQRKGPPEVGLLNLNPVPALVDRVRQELSSAFKPGKPIRISRAPGRLDVMGGIAEYTGSLVCQTPIDRAAWVAIQERDDRNLQVISLNLLDEHRPFTFQMPMESLGSFSAEILRREFEQSGRRWASYLAGCLFVLNDRDLISLTGPGIKGLNIALSSTVPPGVGVGSSSAICVATMINLVHHYQLEQSISPMQLLVMCQEVESRITGRMGGVSDMAASCTGESGVLQRLICQPHEMQAGLHLPRGIRVVGINSNLPQSAGDGMYARTRCAAFMGHQMILHRMKEIGISTGNELSDDPMKGYLANLPQDDYKTLFRPQLPEYIKGEDFQKLLDGPIDPNHRIGLKDFYHVQQATDHHVLEARRVRQFVGFLEQAGNETDPKKRRDLLNKAGHLMYASHISYANDALLGADECDRLVQLVRDGERAGLYGARITDRGSGGTVAVLCDISPQADAAIVEIMGVYEKETGKKPESFLTSNPGGWQTGTVLI